MPNPNARERDAVAVLAWDVAHNAVGRAWALAECLRASGRKAPIAGPLAASGKVWLPLRDAEPAIHALPYGDWAGLVQGISAYVATHPHSAVIVSKPRLPSMLMGLEYKRRWGARVIVDIDDWELPLVGSTEGLDASGMDSPPPEAMAQGLKHPYWTRIAEGMLDLADAVTVSNPMLRQRFGGTIVRHARDAGAFDAGRFDKRAMRQRFGLPDDKRIVMFLGTPRPHKGLEQVLSFMEQSGARDLVLCVVDNIRGGRYRATLAAAGAGRLHFVPQLPFGDVPALLSTADFVCLPQSPGAMVAYYQVPAKITDAIAMRVPVMMAASPAVADLFARGVFVNEGVLDAKAFARAVNASPAELAAVTERAHRVFIEEFSVAAGGRTLDACLETAGNKGLPAWAPQALRLMELMSQARQ